MLVAVFLISRALYWAAGVRMVSSFLKTGTWQLLPVSLLRHQLLSSVWYLNSQPPLFNLYFGLLLHLPTSTQTPALYVTYTALGLLLVVTTYLLLIELRVAPIMAFIATLAITLSPSEFFYENWPTYALPSAGLLAVSALCLVRYLRTNRWPYGLGFFSCACALALMNTTYQAVWVLAAFALIVVMVRGRIRQVAMVAAIPVLLVSVWFVKDVIQFGTVTSSSWTGMNLADMTLQPAQWSGQLRKLVHRHDVTPIALVGPWQPVDSYAPRYVPDERTGVPALDDRWDIVGCPSCGEINMNNIAYVRASSLLLHDDLRFIELEPGKYLGNVADGIRFWFTPTDQYVYFVNSPNAQRIEQYQSAFDRLLGWQSRSRTYVYALPGLPVDPSSAAQISWSAVLMFAVDLLITPVLLRLRRRSLGAPAIGTLLFMWGTILYAFLVTSFTDVGENNRFRFELGSLPPVLAVVVVLLMAEHLLPDQWLASRWWRWFGLTATRAE